MSKTSPTESSPASSSSSTGAESGSDYLPAKKVWQRYGVTDMTLHRWVRSRQFPPPDLIINRRRYWKHRTLDAHDASKGA